LRDALAESEETARELSEKLESEQKKAQERESLTKKEINKRDKAITVSVLYILCGEIARSARFKIYGK